MLDDPLIRDAEPSEATSARSARARVDTHPPTPAPEPNVEVVEHGGLRWINIERPGPVDQAWLEEHFEFHPLDYEDVASRNQRPKIDEYPDYLFIVLHFPVFDKAVGRLNAGELDIFIGPDYLITLPNTAAPAGRVPVRALPGVRGGARRAALQGPRLPALQDRRRLLRLLLPDAAEDGQQARPDRGRDLRGPLRGGRARHLQRQAGDHQLPQDHPPAAAPCCATSSAPSSATSPRTSRSTSTTSSTRPSGSGTCSRTTRRSWRRSRTRTSRCSRTASTTCCGCSPRSASWSCRSRSSRASGA